MAAPPFNASHFCSFAQSLRFRWDHDESSIRVSISRAYYGAFLEARDAIQVSSQGETGHLDVIKHFSSLKTPTATIIANTLRSMKKRREKADYDIQLACKKKEAEDAVIEARKILKSLSIGWVAAPDLVPIAYGGIASAVSQPPTT